MNTEIILASSIGFLVGSWYGAFMTYRTVKEYLDTRQNITDLIIENYKNEVKLLKKLNDIKNNEKL